MDFIRRFMSSALEELDVSVPPTTPPDASQPPGATRLRVPTIRFDTSQHPRYQTHHHRSRSASMPDFKGPVCKNVMEFHKTIERVPEKHKTPFESASRKAIEAVCNPDALHVWESDADMDNLLQLAQVIVKLRNIASTTEYSHRGREPAMVIVAEEKKDRDNYSRIAQLIKHLTGSDARTHPIGGVMAFDAIIVVRGVDTDETAAAKRINLAIERVFKIVRPPSEDIVWHHGPVLSLLLTWINTTTSDLRSSLTAITINSALDLFTGVKPSPFARSAKLADFERLEDYANRLKIPVLLIDPGCSMIACTNLAMYMYYWAFYIHTFLPSALSTPHHYKALDDLTTIAFRLRSAADGTYGADTVRMVKSHIDRSLAHPWAKSCIDPSSYTKEQCRGAGAEAQLRTAFELADCPYTTFSRVPGYNLPAFARLPLCPARASSNPTFQHYIAARTGFDFKAATLRPSTHSPFHILLPQHGQSVKLVTERIQGIMMAVLSSVMREREVPRVGRRERETWAELTRAWSWALEGCKGRCPKEVEEKLGFVVGAVRKGTYTTILEGQGKVEKKGDDGWGLGSGEKEERGGRDDGWSGGGADDGWGDNGRGADGRGDGWL